MKQRLVSFGRLGIEPPACQVHLAKKEALEKLHPKAKEADPNTLKTGPIPEVAPVIFDSITGKSIKEAAMHMRGAAGVSGGDADHWRHMATRYDDTSALLCATSQPKL